MKFIAKTKQFASSLFIVETMRVLLLLLLSMLAYFSESILSLQRVEKVFVFILFCRNVYEKGN